MYQALNLICRFINVEKRTAVMMAVEYIQLRSIPIFPITMSSEQAPTPSLWELTGRKERDTTKVGTSFSMI